MVTIHWFRRNPRRREADFDPMTLESQEDKFTYLDADGNGFIDSTDWEEDRGISAQFDNLLTVHDKNGNFFFFFLAKENTSLT